jgi:hydrogenase nickel incorporation protein HypA/HybF
VHELAICQSVIDQVESLARVHGSRRVARVTLAIGALAGVEPELLAQAFEIARAGTVAEGAQLEIRCTPVQVTCLHCGHTSAASPPRLVCPSCDTWQVRVISGEEMLLQSVELITGADAPDNERTRACAEPAAAQ